MKKIFTLSVLLVGLSVATFAAGRPASKISVTSKTNSSVEVKIDGQNYSLDRFGSIMNNITPGYHRVEITTAGKRGMFRWNRNQVIFSSSMMIDPATMVDICVDAFGKVSVSKSFFGTPARDNRGGDHKDIDYGHGYKNDRDDHYGRH